MTRLVAAASRGQLDAAMKAEGIAIGKGTKAAVTIVTDQVKRDARAVVNAGFTGSRIVGGGNRRVANAIRSRVYPRGDGGFTGQVWSKFGRGRAKGFVDYLLPFVKGATLTPRRSRWLYIPVERGRKARRGRRLSIGLNRNLKFVPARGGDKVYLVRQTRTRSTLIAVLVRRVRIPKKLDFERAAAAAAKRLPLALAEEIEKAS
ncbi:MAG TPA: hypothetical protein VLA52_07095 [Thermohalobaculum sp.]|nr:hypothetical protein [Thermohalobaculum sp.]